MYIIIAWRIPIEKLELALKAGAAEIFYFFFPSFVSFVSRLREDGIDFVKA